MNVWSFLVVVLVTLHVFGLLSQLLSMFSSCYHGCSLCFLVVVLLLSMFSSCCLGYSPCFLVVIMVALYVF